MTEERVPVPTADGNEAARIPVLHALELVSVSTMYYVDRRSKIEISEELGISRFRVARLLDEAVSKGIIKIEVRTPSHIDIGASTQLRKAYSLEHVIVASADRVADGNGLLQVASAAADFVSEVVTADDVVGIGWGRTLYALVSQLRRLQPCSAVQVVGGMPEVELWMNSVDLVRRFSECAKGQMYTFLLPYLVPDAKTAETLRTDVSYQRAEQMFSSLTFMLAGVGAWQPSLSGLYDLLSEPERRKYRERGVVAEVSGTLFDESGGVVPTELSARAIGIGAKQLMKLPRLVIVASGREKARAARAVLRSGVVNSLITDPGLALELLSS
jgi:DNA-binding transcriptional regulator LsrR (DeoR family)